MTFHHIDAGTGLLPETPEGVLRHRQMLEARTAELWSDLRIPQQYQELLRDQLKPLQAHHLPTYCHSLRVSIFCYHLSDALGEKAFFCTTGGDMHDVGKVECRKELLRESSITKPEYEEIQSHPRDGYKRLLPVLPVEAMLAGRSHSRNGDPRGYGVPLAEMLREVDWSKYPAVVREVFRERWPGSLHEILPIIDNMTTILGVADSFESLHRSNDRFCIRMNGAIRVYGCFESPQIADEGKSFRIDMNDPLKVSITIAYDQNIDLVRARRMVDILFAARKAERLYEEFAK